jgi:transposase InsO family protein
MQEKRRNPRTDLWARFRFAIIGRLFSSPPPRGELVREIKRLSETTWRHPVTGEPCQFAPSTIERWFYIARSKEKDPVGALRREVRCDWGECSIDPKLLEELRKQYKAHKSWSYRLHVDNLAALIENKPELGPMKSYSTVRRFMIRGAMVKRKRRRGKNKNIVEPEWQDREIRSFEAAYVGSLWHFDFHHGSRKILAPDGSYKTPMALGVIDDRSRLACHVQWYLSERAEDLAHAISQAFQKWDLPRSVYSDNGSAMNAAETREGFADLGIHYDQTAARAPYQNAKQETFWGPLEGRLMAMLERVKGLTLDFLNQATQAWVDLDYNRKVHSETGEKPLDRYLGGPDVLRPCPSSEDLRHAFRLKKRLTQRRSDGTVKIEGVRFEIPARYRHIRKLTVRYARWNFDLVHLMDERTGKLLSRIYPLDKEANADGRRRRLVEDPAQSEKQEEGAEEIPPLLQKLLDQYSESGKPPAYIPKPFRKDPEEAAQNDNDNDPKEKPE